jgi:hypothetical protein
MPSAFLLQLLTVLGITEQGKRTHKNRHAVRIFPNFVMQKQHGGCAECEINFRLFVFNQ